MKLAERLLKELPEFARTIIKQHVRDEALEEAATVNCPFCLMAAGRTERAWDVGPCVDGKHYIHVEPQGWHKPCASAAIRALKSRPCGHTCPALHGYCPECNPTVDV